MQPPWKSWIRARLSIGVKTKGGLSPRDWAAKLWPVHSVKQYNNVGKPRHTHQYVCVSQLTLNESVLIKFHLQEVQKQAQLTCVIKKIEVSFVWGLLSVRGHEREPVGVPGTSSVLVRAAVMWVDSYVKILAKPNSM